MVAWWEVDLKRFIMAAVVAVPALCVAGLSAATAQQSGSSLGGSSSAFGGSSSSLGGSTLSSGSMMDPMSLFGSAQKSTSSDQAGSGCLPGEVLLSTGCLSLDPKATAGSRMQSGSMLSGGSSLLGGSSSLGGSSGLGGSGSSPFGGTLGR